jgi:hypothetical protein
VFSRGVPTKHAVDLQQCTNPYLNEPWTETYANCVALGSRPQLQPHHCGDGEQSMSVMIGNSVHPRNLRTKAL